MEQIKRPRLDLQEDQKEEYEEEDRDENGDENGDGGRVESVGLKVYFDLVEKQLQEIQHLHETNELFTGNGINNSEKVHCTVVDFSSNESESDSDNEVDLIEDTPPSPHFNIIRRFDCELKGSLYEQPGFQENFKNGLLRIIPNITSNLVSLNQHDIADGGDGEVQNGGNGEKRKKHKKHHTHLKNEFCEVDVVLLDDDDDDSTDHNSPYPIMTTQDENNILREYNTTPSDIHLYFSCLLNICTFTSVPKNYIK